VIADFSLAIVLGVIRCEKSMGYVFGAEAGNLLAGEISSIFRDDSVGILKLLTMFCQRNLAIFPSDLGE